MSGPAYLESDGCPERIPLRRVEWLLIFGFWTLIAIVMAVNGLLDPRVHVLLKPVSPLALVAMAFCQFYLWAILTPPVFWMAGNPRIEDCGFLVRLLLFVAVGLAVSIFDDLVTNYLRYRVFFVPSPLLPITPAALRVRRLWFMDEFIVYIAVLAAAHARSYFYRYRARREEAIRLKTQAVQLQAQLADARLAALRTQLNPHFLFNTLHAVSALVERDPRGVRRMIARLSELLRISLEEVDEQEIPLHREIVFTERYLEIMQIRFQGHLQVRLLIDPDARAALVPNLILQPLVENAVKHGISKIDGIGRIEISARRIHERLLLGVRDNGPALGASGVPAAEGVGLRNTRARLSQLYGPAQHLQLAAAGGGGLIAEVSLPFHTRADLRAEALAAHI